MEIQTPFGSPLTEKGFWFCFCAAQFSPGSLPVSSHPTAVLIACSTTRAAVTTGFQAPFHPSFFASYHIAQAPCPNHLCQQKELPHQPPFTLSVICIAPGEILHILVLLDIIHVKCCVHSGQWWDQVPFSAETHKSIFLYFGNASFQGTECWFF